jgi:dihydrofolate reductase
MQARRPLPLRRQRECTCRGCRCCTWPDLVRRVHPGHADKEILICGGAKVFEEALPIATRLYLTRVREILVFFFVS